MARAAEQIPTQIISIPEVKTDEISFVIVGDTPLISDRMPEDAIQSILDTTMKKAKVKKAAYDPKKSFLGGLYKDQRGRNCFRADALKLAAISATAFVDGITKVEARTIFVKGDYLPIEGDPVMVEDRVWRKGIGATRQIRHRPHFEKWKIPVTVRFDRDVLSREQILYLFEKAGLNIGIGAFRPEKGKQNGMFHVERG